jgi:Family of unknown function (DUF6518)
VTGLRLALVVLIAAVALGVGGRLLLHSGIDLPAGGRLAAAGSIGKALGAPWLAVAWGLGALAASRWRGALAGAAALVLGTLGWYLLTLWLGGRAAAGYVLPVAMAWSLLATAGGAAFGLAGALWRDGGQVTRALSIAALAGALAGEAILLAGEWSGRAAQAVLAAELTAALLILLAARRHAPLALTVGLFGLIALGVAGVEDAARDAARAAGWRGP